VAQRFGSFSKLYDLCCRGGESSAWTAAEEKLFLEGLNLYGM
jgi:hypothetical protein